MNGAVVSVTAGPVQTLTSPLGAPTDSRAPAWTSGIFKSPVTGFVRVTQTALEGDQQADLKNHGGPDNVLLAYAAAHYAFWRKELALPDLAFGSFGENVTLAGDFSDETVCVGDTWKIGPVVLQVTQPRQPCWKLARRLNRPEVVKKVIDRGWGGWYSRVLAEGAIATGMAVELLARPHPEWNLIRAVKTMYARNHSPDAAGQLARLPELSARWKQELMD